MNKYSNEYTLRLIASLMVVTAYGYLFAKTRESAESNVIKKGKTRNNQIQLLEENRKRLTLLSMELEKRVIERTNELDNAKKKAEVSEKIKTEFLAQMSHEIRSPLNVVLSFIQLIRMELESSISEDLQFSFQSIDSASTRIIRTIDLILNMTDLQLGFYEKSISTIDVNSMLNQIHREYFQTAKNKNLELKINANLRISTTNSDEYALIQIISNLVDNAIKYTESGFVEISAEKSDSQILTIKVSDSGIGMDDQFLPNILNSFSQEQQPSSKSQIGNGLGMALVKNYCDIISCTISIKSKINFGTTITLKIPELSD